MGKIILTNFFTFILSIHCFNSYHLLLQQISRDVSKIFWKVQLVRLWHGYHTLTSLTNLKASIGEAFNIQDKFKGVWFGFESDPIERS